MGECDPENRRSDQDRPCGLETSSARCYGLSGLHDRSPKRLDLSSRLPVVVPDTARATTGATRNKMPWLEITDQESNGRHYREKSSAIRAPAAADPAPFVLRNQEFHPLLRISSLEHRLTANLPVILGH
jgi:hypothetical protein